MFSAQNSFSVLYTLDVDGTAAFFEKLGFTLQQHESDKVVVTFGSFELHYVLSSSEPFEAYRYIALPGHYGDGVIFYVETSNIEQAIIKVANAGGALKTGIFDNKWECREFLFEDPNGYKFSVYQAK